ncbi:Predicted oxidoreductase [Palleronia marisminoris]|uniref:Oxidoreductase YdhF n=1 Tax=Palleronia marisminoris TaxID=315423 RepID=A0A1Y5T719_9RHOB|nr:aldo/keto reductase [Palleronia marisminoris]SFH21517.1 Predicted oxidoreductase [Palleronia marisminoris]SLN57372.1 Oxidoreductase YdhF [Palleronia marisminoris]
MDRVRLTPDLDFSRIAYGMWRLADDADTSPAHVQAKIEACLDHGITTMDQADIYGGYMAEEVLGRALTPALRDRIEIVTKCGIVAPTGRHADARGKHYDTSRAYIEASVEASLRLMGIEAIDLLLIHRPDPLMNPAETGAALDDLVRSGKVRAVGVSNFLPHDFTLLQSAMQTPLVTNQVEMSLGRLDPFTNGELAFLQERKLHPMAWSPLGGGHLMTDEGPLQQIMDRIAGETGTDRAAVALAWLLAHPAGIVPVVGTNNLDRIAKVGAALDLRIDRETWFELYTHALGHEVA